MSDFSTEDLKSPKLFKLMCKMATNTIDKQRKSIVYFRTKVNRLQKRVQTLKDLVVILKKTKKVSNNCQLVLEV